MDINISWFRIIFLSNSFLSLELLKYIGAFQKKCRLLPFIVWLGLLCNLEEKYLSFNVLVSNSNCLKYLCALTFLTYRFYFLLNLTILFFTYFFWNVWFDLICQPCVPLNSVPFFFIFCLNLHFLKGKQTWSWLFNASFAFSSFKDFFQKILKIWTNKKIQFVSSFLGCSQSKIWLYLLNQNWRLLLKF